MTVAEAVGRTIARLGASHIFGVVGSGNFQVTNALIDAGVPFTASRHEMGAACMADAYSRATGDVSILSVHQGCGLTNALTGIVEAAKCHTPLLVLTGDTVAGNVTDNFYVDQDAMVASAGARPARIHSAASAVADAAKAFHVARSERATVVLSMPVDVQDEYVDFDAAAIPPLPVRLPPGAAPQALQRLAHALGTAERPVIVGGRGAWNAAAELRRLAEVSGALLATSAAGRGLFVGDEWALDIMGGFATEGAAELIAGADVLVAFGAGLNKWTTREGELLRNATVIQVDDRETAIGFHHPVDVGVVGDAAVVAAAVAEMVAERYPGRVGYRTAEIGERVQAVRYWKDQPFVSRAEPGRVDPQELVNTLDAMLPMERVVVTDGGNVNCYAGAHLRVPDQRGYCIPLSFQSIGLGLSSAIGAGLAQPGRMPVLGTGDGAFMMTLVELDTAVRLAMGMVVIVFNDDAYGAEVNLFQDRTDTLATVRFPETDIAAIARGYGCEAITVRAIEDVDAVRSWLDGPRNRPLIIDAKIPEHTSWMMARRHGAH
ncbi:thiamine pyrophosphate-binding protein [Phytoactinopolyspora halotolerans]|uniref:Thiamine pyrophosphate-binding protein n=1 Tax=Phytoactinopolyspora halotolerans TaxID=1981512 RepID=A0A6L9S750_9ACTN|nr:thiamine pyrophosphate-binding protein [Phytoactinopolyspora halotolerans]